ncbi:MAG: DMT family transporter [Alphaproteobacteria bacterium]
MAERGDSRVALGLAILAISVPCYSISVIIARAVYEHGGNALACLLVRMGFFATAVFIYFRVVGQSPWLPRRESIASLSLGILSAMQSFAYYKAFEYIPVSLAALLVYTYPPMVAVATRVISREALTPVTIGALAAAFVGIGLVLRVSFETLHPLGIACGMIAAVGMAVTTLISSRILVRADSRRMTLHIAISAFAIYLGGALATGGVSWPHGLAGWALLALLPLIYLVASLAWYTCLPMLGPMKASLMSNAEPVFTVAFAALLLGEFLSPVQMAGAALIIGAIFAIQLFRRPSTTRGASR